MLSSLIVLTLALLSGQDTKEGEKALVAIRAAYEANRAALSATSTIRFHSCDGELGSASNVEGFDAALKGDWKRLSPSEGVYFCDGLYRRQDNLHTLEVLKARRVKTSPTTAMSTIWSRRLLTDGETTLIDNIGVGTNDQTTIHSANLRAGVKEFYRLVDGIPLSLGNPDPPSYDLGKCLSKVLERREGAVLVEFDDAARLDGVPVVKISVDFQTKATKQKFTFWVDLGHGAIPVQTRLLEYVPHGDVTALIQMNNHDIKRVERGWLPFRWSLAEAYLTPSGGTTTSIAREVVIEEANFTQRPYRAVFALAFPTDVTVSDSDRLLGFGRRRVWDVNDFSPAARSRAKPLKLGNSTTSIPTMPVERIPWGWRPVFLTLLGIVLLLTSCTIFYRKAHRHEPSFSNQ